MGNCQNSQKQIKKPKKTKRMKRRTSNQYSDVDIQLPQALNDFDGNVQFQGKDKIVERENKIVEYKTKKEKAKLNISAEEIQKKIHLEITPRQKVVKTGTQLPVQIKVHTNSDNNARAPIDLVCVVDDSGSMGGKKAQLVRQSLKYLLKILNEDDRICLVSFDDNSKILTPFLRNTEENKSELKKAIKFFQGRMCTNIASGMDNGLWMLKNRKYKNPVSCVFLLSDGVDNSGTGAVRQVEKLIKKYDIKENFTINTYGFGSDHDPKVMTDIAKFKEGNFYYIENLKKVSEWFVLSLSGLLTVCAEDVQITLKEKNYKINKIYGDEVQWSKDKKSNNVINMPYLIFGETKDFICEIDIKNPGKVLSDEEKVANLLKGELQAKAVGEEFIYRLQTELEVRLLNENEKLEEKEAEISEEVEVGYLRSKGAEILENACKMSENGKYDEGKTLITQFQNEMEKSPFKDHKKLEALKKDCEKSKEMCKPRVFEQQGRAYLYKQKNVHMKRCASICNADDWNEQQFEMMDGFKQGKCQLSDDSCCSGGSDEEDNGKINGNMIQNLPQRRLSYIKPRRGSFVSDEEHSEQEESVGSVSSDSPRLNRPKVLSTQLQKLSSLKSFEAEN